MTRTYVAPLLLLALLLGACEDPSNVGIDLVGGGQDTVSVARLALPIGRDTTAADLTGGTLSGTALTQSRVLAGRAVHPTLGTVDARGYLDFGRPSTLPAGFLDRTIIAVELVLQRDYAYGSTNGPSALRLYDAAEEFAPITNNVTASADSAVAEGGFVTGFSVSATDSIVTVALPAEWVAANDAVLRDSTFGADFHGFLLRAPDDGNGAVYGFKTSAARMRVYTAQDTVTYPAVDVHTQITKTGGAPSPDYVVLQDGSGRPLTLELPVARIDSMDLRDRALTIGRFRLTVDSEALEALRAGGFEIDLPGAITLVGQRGTSADPLAQATLQEVEDGEATYTFPLTAVLQDVLLRGESLYDQFLLYFPSSPTTLDVAVFPTAGDPAAIPNALVLVVAPEFN